VRNLPQGRSNGSKNVSFEIRKGKVGCLFDEMGNLVEPTERRYTGEQHCGERPDTMSGQARKRNRIAKRSGIGRAAARHDHDAPRVVERLQGDPEPMRGVRCEAPINPKRSGRSHAFGSPVPGEHMGEAYTPNAATRSRGWSASEAGERSFAV
jgi:hypothetical protein